MTWEWARNISKTVFSLPSADLVDSVEGGRKLFAIHPTDCGPGFLFAFDRTDRGG